MNEKNFQYLKDNLKYLGFGEHLNDALAGKMQEGLSAFSLSHKTEMNRKPFEATLQFKRSDASDLYFLNSYSASLIRSNGERVDQSFFLDNGKGVTAKEAYNLLEGRSVFKELTNRTGEKYHAWLQIDFDKKDKRDNHELKQFHENYGYDLKAAVSKFAVAELKDPEKESSLLHSLQKGNVQSATVEKDGFTHKVFLEANPQFKTVNLYDAGMKRVQKEDLGKYQSADLAPGVKKEEPSQKQEVSKENKQDIKKNSQQQGQTKGRSGKKSVGV